MTNLEKFIEIMNKTFNARMKPENMELFCSPCGTLKKYNHACKIFSCEKCKAWWHKEWHSEESLEYIGAPCDNEDCSAYDGLTGQCEINCNCHLAAEREE